MAQRFEPRSGFFPPAQREIWPQLAPAQKLSFVLYGGTAVALHLGHRASVDYDFFRSESLDKNKIKTEFAFLRDAQIVKEDPESLVVSATMPSGPVQVSYFGKIEIGHINEPLLTTDLTLLVASLDDLMATKLKAILDRAEAKDYSDIAAMLSARVSLERGLAGFAKMFATDPALPLKAMGYFKDGDLPSLPKATQDLLRASRDRVREIPDIILKQGLV